MNPGLFDGPEAILGVLDPPLRLGTSSWSSPDWKGSFYPRNAPPGKFLEHYARQYDLVECDATFYATPAEQTIANWKRRTPQGFLMASKLPREITHERGMVDCDELLLDHLRVMSGLEERLGPFVAQFAHLPARRDAEESRHGWNFIKRLATFLEAWPSELELTVEVRNRGWIAEPLLELLREKGVGLVLPVYATMPDAATLFSGPQPVTSDLVYVRFLGSHHEMDLLVERLIASGDRQGEWSELAVDRTDEMRQWARPLRELAAAGNRVMTLFNNHYAGYAPGSVEQFAKIWRELE